MKLCNEKVCIEILNLENCDFENYLKWINDYPIMKFTMSRFKSYNVEDLKTYIIHANENNEFLFGIFYENKHIGNVRISKIVYPNKTCEVGLIIGEKKLWGKGLATRVIELIAEFIFNYLDLFKIKVEIIDINEGSYKAFLKNGFKIVGRMEKEFFIEGCRYDTIWMEKLNPRYKI
jgi:RimJ/RimL family protein N-acetyltransferase